MPYARHRSIHGLCFSVLLLVASLGLTTSVSAQIILDGGGGDPGEGGGCTLPGPVPGPNYGAPLASHDRCDRVELTWGTASNATSYKVFRNGTQIGTAPMPGDPLATEYYDYTADRGVHYTYTIKGTNSCGDGDASQAAVGWTAPVASDISNLQATDGGYAITFTWSGGSGALRYRLYRDGAQVMSFAGPVNTLSYNEAECGTHLYGLRTHNCEDGNLITRTYTAPATSGTPSAPATAGPPDGSLQCASSTVNLQWVVYNCYTSFDLQVANNSAFNSPTTISTTNLSYPFTGNPGTTYWWRVRRNTTGGTSAYTSPLSFTVGGLPSLGNLSAPEVVRRIDGVVQGGPVYWNETGTITLAPTPTQCPCSYHWTPVNPQNGNFATSASGNQASGYNIGVLSNITYMWNVDMTNGVGTSSQNLGFAFIADFRPEGGCPYVAVWDGAEYRDDNNILPASEYAGGAADVTDFYRLTQPAAVVDGEYRLKLREFEHHRSAIDEVKLLAIDHPMGSEVAVDAAGGVTAYERVERLAETGRTGDSFAGLASPFGGGLRLKAGEAVMFASPIARVPDGDLGVEVVGSSLMKESRTGEIAGRAPGSGQTFAMRQRPSASFVPLASAPVGSIDLRLDQPMELQSANLVRKLAWKGTPVELALVAARNDRGADALKALHGVGEGTASLSPGEEIELRFAATPVPAGMTRSLVLQSRGRYRPVDVSESAPAEAVAAQPAYFRVAAAANGRLQLDYGLERDAQVSLDLVDVRGRIVQKLASGPASAGAHTTVWKDGGLASGVYFARLVRQEAGRPGVQEVRKVAIVR